MVFLTENTTPLLEGFSKMCFRISNTSLFESFTSGISFESKSEENEKYFFCPIYTIFVYTIGIISNLAVLNMAINHYIAQILFTATLHNLAKLFSAKIKSGNLNQIITEYQVLKEISAEINEIIGSLVLYNVFEIMFFYSFNLSLFAKADLVLFLILLFKATSNILIVWFCVKIEQEVWLSNIN
jgi:hypothetical protein